MNPLDQDLHEMALAEARKFKARAVLAQGRPVVAWVLANVLLLVAALLCQHLFDAATTTRGIAIIALILTFNLVREVGYLNRRLTAVMVLLDLSKDDV